jgi:hypothetical protein
MASLCCWAKWKECCSVSQIIGRHSHPRLRVWRAPARAAFLDHLYSPVQTVHDRLSRQFHGESPQKKEKCSNGGNDVAASGRPRNGSDGKTVGHMIDKKELQDWPARGWLANEIEFSVARSICGESGVECGAERCPCWEQHDRAVEMYQAEKSKRCGWELKWEEKDWDKDFWSRTLSEPHCLVWV